MSSYPLRVTAEQWQDIREHYEDPMDEELLERCRECGEPLYDDVSYDGLCADCADAAEADAPQDDHDRRFSDMHDTREGDDGQEPF